MRMNFYHKRTSCPHPKCHYIFISPVGEQDFATKRCVFGMRVTLG